MSTKIFDAYRLPSTITDPFEIVEPLRQDLLAARLHAEAQVVYRTAIDLIDRWCTHHDPERMRQRTKRDGTKVELWDPTWPWYSAIHQLKDDQQWEDPAHTWHDPFRCEVVLLRDPKDGRLLAKAFIADPLIREALEQHAATHEWEDWHYQNQTDQPEEVPEDQWRERLASWDRAAGPNGSFATRSLSIRLDRTWTHAHVMGVGDEETAALAKIETISVATRLARILAAAVLKAEATEEENPGEVFSSYLRARSIVQTAREAEHPAWMEALDLIDEVTVEGLLEPRKEPLVSHRLDEDTAARFARTLLGAYSDVD